MRRIWICCVILAAVVVAVATACDSALDESSERPPGSTGSQASCVDAWNTHDDGANRERVVSAKESWQVEVSTWIVNHPAPDTTGEGCSYLFAANERWLSFSGKWMRDGTFEWQFGLTQAGLREAGQRIELTSLDVQPDGSLR